MTPLSKHEIPPPPEQAIEAVRRLNNAYIDAVRRGDDAWFTEHMSEHVVVVLGNGRRVEKSAFVTALRDDPTRYRSLVVRNVRVRAFSTVVQVDAESVWELDDGRTGVSRYIDAYAWTDSGWRVISAQITPLPGSDPR